jgi:hypothetical protein
MAVVRRGARELGAAVGAHGLGRLSGFLAPVPQQVAEGGELAAFAPVFPALRLRSALHHADLASVGRGPTHHLGDGVQGHARIGGYQGTSAGWLVLCTFGGGPKVCRGPGYGNGRADLPVL